jgi:hypothetical protein
MCSSQCHEEGEEARRVVPVYCIPFRSCYFACPSFSPPLSVSSPVRSWCTPTGRIVASRCRSSSTTLMAVRLRMDWGRGTRCLTRMDISRRGWEWRRRHNDDRSRSAPTAGAHSHRLTTAAYNQIVIQIALAHCSTFNYRACARDRANQLQLFELLASRDDEPQPLDCESRVALQLVWIVESISQDLPSYDEGTNEHARATTHMYKRTQKERAEEPRTKIGRQEVRID